MRKVLLFVFPAIIITFCSVIISCTTDDELEVAQTEKEAKAVEMNKQILAMAEEYGLNVVIGDLRGIVDDKDALSKVEKIFENACKVKGNYKLSSNRNGHVVTVKQDSKFKMCKKSLTRSVETFDFEDYKDGVITVSCSLRYTEYPESGDLGVDDVDANIDDPTTLHYDCIDDVTGSYNSYKAIIEIRGSVRAEYYSDDSWAIDTEPYLTIKYSANGYFDGSDGEISWE